jgi:WXG100 family type VII secretion target
VAFLVDLEQLQALIAQIVSMQSELSVMAAKLQANRAALETAWQGGSTPVHVAAEMDRIARSMAENADALNRLSHALQQINAAYEQTEQQISQMFHG